MYDLTRYSIPRYRVDGCNWSSDFKMQSKLQEAANHGAELARQRQSEQRRRASEQRVLR